MSRTPSRAADRVTPSKTDIAPILAPLPRKKPAPTLGHVTSSYMSPNLGRSIALAVVKAGGARIGERVFVARRDGDPIPVRVSEADFLAVLGRRP